MDEETLLREVHRDPRKFGGIYDAFYGRIFAYALRRTADYHTARDIAAETFLKAFSGIGKFRWRNISILHWLYRIATNELNRHARDRSYRPESLGRIQEEYGFDITDDSNAETERVLLEEEIERHREFVRINERLKGLDVKYQEVIALRYYERKSIREIAAILGKKEGTVKSLLSRGIDALKDNRKG